MPINDSIKDNRLKNVDMLQWNDFFFFLFEHILLVVLFCLVKGSSRRIVNKAKLIIKCIDTISMREIQFLLDAIEIRYASIRQTRSRIREDARAHN